jgi:putative tryptophan/tyrosine transport system substrate-binding protein
MRRREFITLLGGATAWPLAAHAQQPAMPVIGFLGTRAPGDDPHLLTAFRLGLKEAGYIEGQNVAIEYRFAENQYDRLPALAADLVRRQVSVIAANGHAAQAAKAATATIPIAFVAGFDPVEVGLVTSLNRPGGNITGVSILDVELGPKRLELLHELVPRVTVIAVLVNPSDPARAETTSKELQAAARILRVQLHVLHASTERDFDTVFANIVQLRAGGLVIGGEPFFNSRSEQLGELTMRHAMPTIYQLRTFAAAGGLASYGASLTDAYRLAGVYSGRILKGEKPSCRFSRLQKSSLLSTSKPRRPSALRSRFRCLAAPTRSLNETVPANETTRVHHASRRRGIHLAAGRARAAAGDAGTRSRRLNQAAPISDL